MAGPKFALRNTAAPLTASGISPQKVQLNLGTVLAGSLLVVEVQATGGDGFNVVPPSVQSITDTLGSTWTEAVFVTSADGFTASAAIYYAVVVSGGADTITVTVQSGGTGIAASLEAAAQEFTGAAASPLGTSASSNGGNRLTAASDVNSDDLILAVVGDSTGASTQGTIYPAPGEDEKVVLFSDGRIATLYQLWSDQTINPTLLSWSSYRGADYGRALVLAAAFHAAETATTWALASPVTAEDIGFVADTQAWGCVPYSPLAIEEWVVAAGPAPAWGFQGIRAHFPSVSIIRRGHTSFIPIVSAPPPTTPDFPRQIRRSRSLYSPSRRTRGIAVSLPPPGIPPSIAGSRRRIPRIVRATSTFVPVEQIVPQKMPKSPRRLGPRLRSSRTFTVFATDSQIPLQSRQVRGSQQKVSRSRTALLLPVPQLVIQTLRRISNLVGIKRGRSSDPSFFLTPPPPQPLFVEFGRRNSRQANWLRPSRSHTTDPSVWNQTSTPLPNNPPFVEFARKTFKWLAVLMHISRGSTTSPELFPQYAATFVPTYDPIPATEDWQPTFVYDAPEEKPKPKRRKRSIHLPRGVDNVAALLALYHAGEIDFEEFVALSNGIDV